MYVDGQPAVRAGGNFFYETPGKFDVDDAGIAAFLPTDGEQVKRYRITPAADTTVATLIEMGTSPGSLP